MRGNCKTQPARTRGDAQVAWVPLHGDHAVLAVMREGTETVVTLPAVGAWDCGYLLVEGMATELRK